jgi:hypothetical protein
MHRSNPGRRGMTGRLLAASGLAATAALLAACSSLGESASDNVVANTIFGAPNTRQQNAVVLDAEHFGKSEAVVACPPVSIRPGTEQIVVYQPGKVNEAAGEKPAVQYQASIDTTARECHNAPEGGVTVKLGVQGHVVGGPAAKAGTVTLPLRVAVLQGSDKILKSELFKIGVSLQPPDMRADFTKIDDTILVPASPGNTDFRILVGFDEGPAKGGR